MEITDKEKETYGLYTKVNFGKYKGLTINQIISIEKSKGFKWFIVISTFKNYSHIIFDDEVKKKIFSKNRLNLSIDTFNILNKIACPISKKLIKINSNFLNMDSYSFKFDFDKMLVSYRTLFKKGKTEMRLGKFITKLFKGKSIEYTNKELEEFITHLKAYDANSNNFIIIEGEDIRKYYDESCYQPGKGSLNKSCMRYSKYQPYFNIYCDNPNAVKLLIYKESNKIKGRALIWQNVRFTTIEVSSNRLMDRIYSLNPSIEQKFKNWAKANNVVYKYKQNHKFKKEFCLGTKVFASRVETDIDNIDRNIFPYMDTFSWAILKNNYDFKKGILLRNLKIDGETCGKARNCRGYADF